MCRNERRKCKAACSAKIEIARLTLQWEFFHPLSIRMHRSCVFAHSIRFRMAIARSVLLSVHKFAFSRVRSRSVYTSFPHRKNRLLQRPHFLHGNARASKLARCDFHSLHFISAVLSLSLSVFLFYIFARDLYLLLLQFHAWGFRPFILEIRNINIYTRVYQTAFTADLNR